MTKSAADLMTTKKKDSKEQKVSRAKRAFFVSLFDLSWRMFIAMLLPLLIGLNIDGLRGGSGQAFTYIGFVVGMVSSALVVRGVVRKLAK